MADERAEDARVLLAGQRWAFAYYVAGYAVECALKSCVLARLIHTGLVFEDRVPDCKVHDLQKLLGHAGLTDELKAARTASPKFADYWSLAVLWVSDSRYGPRSQSEAENLVTAVTDPTDGVLQWLRNYW